MVGERDLGIPELVQKVSEKNPKCATFLRKLNNKKFKSIINGSTHLKIFMRWVFQDTGDAEIQR